MNQWFPIALFAGVLALPAAATAIDRSSPTVTKVVTTPAPAATAPIAAGRPASEPAPLKAIRAKAPATGHVERVLAGQKCREKSFDDTAEFRFDYGRGPASMRRCITQEIREARFSCRQEALEDPADFRSEFGTGATARVRCIRHELT